MSAHLGLSHAARDAARWGSHVNRCTNTFLSVFSWRAGTRLNFRGLNFRSNVPKFWFTTTSGICRVARSFWNSLERKNEMWTIITFNKSCPSRNPHHTWDGTFEPMVLLRCLRKRSANRMNELEQTGISVRTSLNWEGKQDMCSCSHNSSGKLIPSHSQGWSTPPEDLIFPHFFHSENIFLKKSKVFLGMEMQPLAECERKTFGPEGAYSTFKGLYGCSFCSPAVPRTQIIPQRVKCHWWGGSWGAESTC